jgi:hypothetical protein
MGAFSIELRLRGGRTIDNILGVQNKPAIGEWFECPVGDKIVKARVVAIRHHPRSGFETIVAQEVEPGGSRSL